MWIWLLKCWRSERRVSVTGVRSKSDETLSRQRTATLKAEMTGGKREVIAAPPRPTKMTFPCLAKLRIVSFACSFRVHAVGCKPSRVSSVSVSRNFASSGMNCSIFAERLWSSRILTARLRSNTLQGQGGSTLTSSIQHFSVQICDRQGSSACLSRDGNCRFSLFRARPASWSAAR